MTSSVTTVKGLANQLPIFEQVPIKQRTLTVPTSFCNRVLSKASEKNVWKLVFSYLIEDKLKLLCD